MNVLFLDYDGVVNTPMWDSTHHCHFNHLTDGKVNNFQAVQWVSAFCTKYNYKIVITSSWRIDDNCAEYLRAGGLWDSVEILDSTPYVQSCFTRGEEIDYWLRQLGEPVNYLILDDDDDFTLEQRARLIQTDTDIGVTKHTYHQLTDLHTKLYKRGERQ